MISTSTIAAIPNESLLQQLAELLLQISEVERRVESTRQLLRERSGYNHSLAFHALDRGRILGITPGDIDALLKSVGLSLKEDEFKMLWTYLDKNADGKLDWNEFHREFSTHDSTFLALSAYEVYVLTDKLKLGLARILEEEAHGLIELDRAKQKLAQLSNYSIEHLFSCLDQGNKGYLTIHDIENFLSEFVPDRLASGEGRFGSGASSFNKPARIIRRLDQNFDSVIHLEEFANGIRPIHPSFVSKSLVYDSVTDSVLQSNVHVVTNQDYLSRRTGRTVTRVNDLTGSPVIGSRSPTYYTSSSNPYRSPLPIPSTVTSQRILGTNLIGSNRVINASPAYRDVVAGSRSPSYRVIAQDNVHHALPQVTTYGRNYVDGRTIVNGPTLYGADYRSRSPTYQRVSHSPSQVHQVPLYSYQQPTYYPGAHIATHNPVYASPARVYASPQRTFVQPTFASPIVYHQPPQVVVSPVITYSPVQIIPEQIIMHNPEPVYYSPVVETHYSPNRHVVTNVAPTVRIRDGEIRHVSSAQKVPVVTEVVTVETKPVVLESPKVIETVTTTVVEQIKPVVPEIITTVVEEVKPLNNTQVITTVVEETKPSSVVFVEPSPVVETVQTTTVTKQVKKPKKKIVTEQVTLVPNSLTPTVEKIVTSEVFSPAIVTPVVAQNVVEQTTVTTSTDVLGNTTETTKVTTTPTAVTVSDPNIILTSNPSNVVVSTTKVVKPKKTKKVVEKTVLL